FSMAKSNSEVLARISGACASASLKCSQPSGKVARSRSMASFRAAICPGASASGITRKPCSSNWDQKRQFLIETNETTLMRRGLQVFEKMERETGLEPATSSLGSWHSTTELLPLVSTKSTQFRNKNGHQTSERWIVILSFVHLRIPFSLERDSAHN